MPKLFGRIFTDIKIFKKSNLHENGIYCDFDEKNLYKMRALIIGPGDTPYENGFYLFKLEFPPNYPLYPPKVTYLTQGDYIRFNPNLYTNGKVCVSILNTWSGPGWTTSCSLTSVLLSIQTLLNNYPIHNEPGWDTVSNKDIRSINYNTILKYANLKIAIIKTLENPPSEYDVFKDIMLNHLHKSSKTLYNYIEQNIEFNENKTLKSEIYNLQIKTNFKKYKNKLDKLLKIPINQSNIDLFIYNPRDKTNELNTTIKPLQTDETQKETQKEKKTIKRGAPNKNSKLFEVGYEKISENNGKLYFVSLTTTNKKRWKLKV